MRVCARVIITRIGFLCKGFLRIRYRIHLAALAALWLCNALPDLEAVESVVASDGVCILVLAHLRHNSL